jgi:hypothetical protein
VWSCSLHGVRDWLFGESRAQWGLPSAVVGAGAARGPRTMPRPLAGAAAAKRPVPPGARPSVARDDPGDAVA